MKANDEHEDTPRRKCPLTANRAFNSNTYSTVSQKNKSCLSQKGNLPSVVVEDIPNNPTSADFSYHIRIVGFLALKFQIFIISAYFFWNFPFILSYRKRCFLLEKRDFNIFQFGKSAIRDPLGHDICR